MAKSGRDRERRLSRTEEGTPQGGIISPLLLIIALHGMEKAAGADVVWNTASTDAAEPRLIHLDCNTTRQPPGLA